MTIQGAGIFWILSTTLFWRFSDGISCLKSNSNSLRMNVCITAIQHQSLHPRLYPLFSIKNIWKRSYSKWWSLLLQIPTRPTLCHFNTSRAIWMKCEDIQSSKPLDTTDGNKVIQSHGSPIKPLTEEVCWRETVRQTIKPHRKTSNLHVIQVHLHLLNLWMNGLMNGMEFNKGRRDLHAASRHRRWNSASKFFLCDPRTIHYQGVIGFGKA